ncbi:hypothetical protein R3P38DRAFT_3174105 [Favolaschia claudopus]|uniref:Uncharacterized protein n=1 Tax=Favolaschia claudopus TaxID=2862362 RepID=A0AAW0DI92_9AGAR
MSTLISQSLTYISRELQATNALQATSTPLIVFFSVPPSLQTRFQETANCSQVEFTLGIFLDANYDPRAFLLKFHATDVVLPSTARRAYSCFRLRYHLCKAYGQTQRRWYQRIETCPCVAIVVSFGAEEIRIRFVYISHPRAPSLLLFIVRPLDMVVKSQAALKDM